MASAFAPTSLGCACPWSILPYDDTRDCLFETILDHPAQDVVLRWWREIMLCLNLTGSIDFPFLSPFFFLKKKAQLFQIRRTSSLND